MALRPLGFLEVCNAWVGQAPRERSFFTPDLVGMLQALSQQEAVGGDAETGVVFCLPFFAKGELSRLACLHSLCRYVPSARLRTGVSGKRLETSCRAVGAILERLCCTTGFARFRRSHPAFGWVSSRRRAARPCWILKVPQGRQRWLRLSEHALT